MTDRHIIRRIRGSDTSDGAGVKLKRIIGQPGLDMVDPFLLLDEFRSDTAGDYIAGFPEHPHRGFETVTYMLAGHMQHGDNHGNRGDLVPGSVQWMTAGRGILHSEMPQQENGLMWGFQLWVNLPAKDKLTAPRYQDIGPERIPVVHPAAGVEVRLIAGEFAGATGPVSGIATAPVYMDIALGADADIAIPLPEGHSGFAYVFDGAEALVAGERLSRGELGGTVKGRQLADCRRGGVRSRAAGGGAADPGAGSPLRSLRDEYTRADPRSHRRLPRRQILMGGSGRGRPQHGHGNQGSEATCFMSQVFRSVQEDGCGYLTRTSGKSTKPQPARFLPSTLPAGASFVIVPAHGLCEIDERTTGRGHRKTARPVSLL